MIIEFLKKETVTYYDDRFLKQPTKTFNTVKILQGPNTHSNLCYIHQPPNNLETSHFLKKIDDLSATHTNNIMKLTTDTHLNHPEKQLID